MDLFVLPIMYGELTLMVLFVILLESCVGFMMPEIEFFKHYAKEAASHHEYLDSLNQEIESVKAQIPELPFSNIWMAQHMVDKVPAGSEIHLVFIIVFVLGTSLNSLLVFRQNAM